MSLPKTSLTPIATSADEIPVTVPTTIDDLHALLQRSDLSVETKASSMMSFLIDVQKIKYLVFDWDLTILSVHSGGFVEPTLLDGIINSITEDWIVFISEAKRRGIPFYIATFSDPNSVEFARQRTLSTTSFSSSKMTPAMLHEYFDGLMAGEKLIDFALRAIGRAEHNDASFFLPAGVVALYPENYQIAENYAKLGLNGPMRKSKGYHLSRIQERVGIDTRPEDFILFDDDMQNVEDATIEGYHSCLIKNAAVGLKHLNGFRLGSCNLDVRVPGKPSHN